MQEERPLNLWMLNCLWKGDGFLCTFFSRIFNAKLANVIIRIPDMGKKCYLGKIHKLQQTMLWCVYDKDHMNALWIKNTECFLGFICNLRGSFSLVSYVLCRNWVARCLMIAKYMTRTWSIQIETWNLVQLCRNTTLRLIWPNEAIYVFIHWPCVHHMIYHSHITCPVHVKTSGVDHECDNKVVLLNALVLWAIVSYGYNTI